MDILPLPFCQKMFWTFVISPRISVPRQQNCDVSGAWRSFHLKVYFFADVFSLNLPTVKRGIFPGFRRVNPPSHSTKFLAVSESFWVPPLSGFRLSGKFLGFGVSGLPPPPQKVGNLPGFRLPNWESDSQCDSSLFAGDVHGERLIFLLESRFFFGHTCQESQHTIVVNELK